MSTKAERETLLHEQIAELRARLEEAEETLRAIRTGEVDAVVVGDQIYMLTSAEAASNQLRGRALSHVSDAVFMVDNDYRVTWMNATAEQRYYVKSEHALGRLIHEIYRNRWLRPGDEAAARESLNERGRWRGESVHQLRDGSILHVETSLSVFRDDDGRGVGLLVVIQDITTRKQAELEREELLVKESNAREAAEVAMRAKDEFLATVSHELRTPLSAILGWAAMLQRGTLNEAGKAGAVETIVRNARAQAQLIEDLLDAARIMSGKLKPDLEPVELTAVVSIAVDSARHAALAKDIELRLEVRPASYRVMGDAARLQQVVGNLLSNAVKFTPPGGRVEITLTSDERGAARLTVEDTGDGIDAKFLPHVFDRFRQADGTSTRRHGGLGLGLSIVRHLVEMHGGIVQAHSPGLGRGARFTVHLPLVASRHLSRPAESEPNETVSTPLAERPLHGLRILEVDDEADARDVIREALEQFGADVMTASSASEALAAIPAFKPDVVVCDIGMPDEDGFSLIRRIRLVEHGKTVPAVALTGYARADEKMRALEGGYQRFIPKPVEIETLVSIIASLAGRA
ncbi:MAG TPA: ATP-binding protein [Candidatus Krumholzibacteria bacterium]|nr:ATP-binding protein [Candidatus Krumholzibacteria bacterium]